MESTVTAVHRRDLLQTLQAGSTRNGQVPEANHGGAGKEKEGAEESQRDTLENLLAGNKYCQ